MATGDSLVKAELGHAMNRIADLERQLAMKNWPTRYDELMCDPVFRAAYAKEWAITDGDNLRMQLAEAKNLAEWTPIMPDNLPKEGDIVWWDGYGDPLCAGAEVVRVFGSHAHFTTKSKWNKKGYYRFRPIAPPQPEKPSMKSTREIIATNWFGASQPEKEKP